MRVRNRCGGSRCTRVNAADGIFISSTFASKEMAVCMSCMADAARRWVMLGGNFRGFVTGQNGFQPHLHCCEHILQLLNSMLKVFYIRVGDFRWGNASRASRRMNAAPYERMVFGAVLCIRALCAGGVSRRRGRNHNCAAG